MLVKHGYNPIIVKNEAGVIHKASDWTHGLMSFTRHKRDIFAMKWKLY